MAIKNGTAGADTLIGTNVADQLFGKDGNDILKGLAGPDLLDGGNGTDTVNYSGSAAAVGVFLNDGKGSGGDAQGDTYVSIENAVGSSFADLLAGNNLANQLDGGLGKDLMVGGGGNDTMLGGGGDDRVAGGAGADVINGGGGRDELNYSDSVLGVTVNLSTGQAINGNAAGDTITGFEDLSGSFDNDILAGTAVANSILGDDGADRLFGFAGNDTLGGGTGADTMTGHDGADTFNFDFTSDSPAGFFVRDVIQDFNRAPGDIPDPQGDVLDLSFIDANPVDSLNDSFEFLGKGGSSFDAPGQIQFVFENNTTVVQINTVGNDTPEMEIQLRGQIDLVASDFIL